MADFMSATTVPGGRSPASGVSGRAGAGSLAWLKQIRASGHAQRGYWLSVASIAAGVAGLLAVLAVGMVAYFGLAISLDHR